MKSFLFTNLVALLAMILTHSTWAAVYTIDPRYVDWFNIPLGPIIALYLLFGYRALPGLVFGKWLAYCIFDVLSFNQGYGFDLMLSAVDSVAPLAALYTMHYFKLATFFSSQKIVAHHAIFYCFLSSIFVAFARFIFFNESGFFELGGGFIYLMSNFIGSINGSLMFIFMFSVMGYGLRSKMLNFKL